MLVLSRQRDETIMIGNRQTIHIQPTAEELVAALTAKPADPALASLLDKICNAKPGPVEATIVDIRGDKVRVGVNADKALTVHRREVFQAIEREQAA